MQKKKPFRSKEYLAWVASHECLIATLTNKRCSSNVQAHHLLKTHGIKGMGLRNADNESIPLCFDCHQKLHDVYGSESQFFEDYGLIDSVGIDYAKHLFGIYEREIKIFDK